MYLVMCDSSLRRLDSVLLQCYRLVFFPLNRVQSFKTHQGYNGKINFTTDGWTSPNHRAFVAFSAHFEHKGEPLTIPLDVIEVAKVKTYQSPTC
jgi:hypothetical protein